MGCFLAAASVILYSLCSLCSRTHADHPPPPQKRPLETQHQSQNDQTSRGKNADAFRANFAGVDWVKVPLVYWQYTTSEVLVLEYCPGKKINDGPAIDALGLDRQRLARLAVESYLQQILRHGLFHADPHPGNVAVDAGVEGGRCVCHLLFCLGAFWMRKKTRKNKEKNKRRRRER